MIPIGDSLKKGPWSAAEDKILTEYVRIHGEGNWNALQRNTSLQRCGKSCRLRWANHLRPNLKKGAFSADEERLIIDLHSKLGNKWARISAQLPGRTDNEVKNYWNTRVKRRLRQGLPLYPNSHHSQPSFSSISSTQPPPNPPPSPPLPVSLKSQHSFLDPTSLPFPAPFFSFNHPPPGFFIPPSLSSFSFGFNSQHQHVELELPSNQFCPDLAEEDVENVYDYDEVEEEVKFYPNVGERSNNSGLLDALLIEAQSRSAAAKNLKKDCLDGDQWESICGNSSDGVAKMEEQDENAYYTNEDLSSILNLIPSLVTAPKCNEGREQGSAGQSSNISDDNNAMLDAIPQVSSSNTEWFNTSSSYTSWDNLPRIY